MTTGSDNLAQAFYDSGAIEDKIMGSFKDIALLMDCYESIMEANNIDEWSEEDFEAEEKSFHVRRGFELMYRDILTSGRPSHATSEYTAQYGVHPQVAEIECSIYAQSIREALEKNIVLNSNHLEDFLDEMAKKYVACADKTTERLFGKSDISNQAYMILKDRK